MPKVSITATKGLYQESGLGTVSSPMGIIAPQTAKTSISAGAFDPLTLVVNTRYVVEGTLTASACILPAGSPGDVIVIEMQHETAGQLMVANSAAVSFTTDSTQASFSTSSWVRWFASPASNGGALLTPMVDGTTSDGSGDNVLTLTGATAGGPGNGSYLCFTREAVLWRVEGWMYGAGACTAVPNAIFS